MARSHSPSGCLSSRLHPGVRQKENRFTLVRLVTTGGIEGYSAIQSMGAELSGLGGLLGSYLLGERADDIASIRQRIREMGYLGWRVGLKRRPGCLSSTVVHQVPR